MEDTVKWNCLTDRLVTMPYEF